MTGPAIQDRGPSTIDVSVSADMASLILSCREEPDPSRAIQLLQGLLPAPSTLRRSAAGIRATAEHMVPLLSESAPVEVRWTDHARRFVTNRQHAQTVYPQVLASLQRLRHGGAELALRQIPDSAGLGVLDDHQVVNVAAMTLTDGFGLCLFDEQGAGKTVTLIFAYDLLAARDQANRMIIVSPKSMVPEWLKDFARFRGHLYRIVSVTGSAREKQNALQSRSDIYVTNFETVVSMEPHFQSLLRHAPDRNVLVVDESFFVKSPDARRTRALRRLREWCGRAFVLCGTPAPNAPHDLVEQFNLVDFGMTFDGVTVPPDRDLATPVVRRVVEERGPYIRNLKAVVLPDLPTKSFHRLYVSMGPAQCRLYNSLRDSLVTDLRSVSDDQFRRNYTNFLARRSALLQACSWPGSVDSNHDETPAKFLALDDLLNRVVRQQGDKVVLWSFYTATIDALVDRYQDLGVLRYDGRVPDISERSNAVRRFQLEDHPRLLIANPAAAGAGLTLHRARLAVYESMSNQAAHYLQSLDRVHRRGQVRDVEYVVLLCQDTLEVAEYDRLIDKQRMAADLLGDPHTHLVTRETLLSDLSAPTGEPA